MDSVVLLAHRSTVSPSLYFDAMVKMAPYPRAPLPKRVKLPSHFPVVEIPPRAPVVLRKVTVEKTRTAESKKK